MSESQQSEYPPFKLGRPRFDQTTFQGRLRHFMDVIDPRTLFTSDKKLQDAIHLLEDYKRGLLPVNITDKQLWEAQKIKQAIIHPDTGEKIFMPFRMSGKFDNSINNTQNIMAAISFFPVVGLCLPNPSLQSQVLWQWLNQSHNACVNFSNRNATKETPTSRFVLGYVGAVTSAVCIALSLSLLIKRANGLSPSMKLLVQKFVPFPAVATASTCNVLLMRNNELSEGIEIFDKNEKTVGTSKIAARKALGETAVTRMVLPAPILLIPPIVMTFMEKTRFLQRNPRFHLPINAVACTLSFGFALPVAIALFPQVSSIRRDQLEPELRETLSDDTLFYNKGL